MDRANKISIRTALIYWSFTIIYMAIIFFISSFKGQILPLSIKGLDKILHTGIYTVLGFLSYFSFRESGAQKYVFLLSFAFAVLYGITDELHQIYVPGRQASFGDIIADFVGAFLGCYSAAFVKRRKTGDTDS